MSYKIIKNKRVFNGHAFNVELVNLQLPDGREVTYDLVDHTGSVTIIPVDEKGQVIFVRQYRLGSQSLLLELPAGTCPKDENPQDCAMREIREETGFAAGKLTLLGDIFLAPGYSNEHMYIFLAEDLTLNPLKGDDDEFLEVVSLPKDEVYRMAYKGEFHDGKTLAALLLAEEKLRKM